jgi:hypothetical protein
VIAPVVRVLLALAVLLSGGNARADRPARRVVVVAAPPAFVDALEVALSPWGLVVQPVDGPAPPADSGEAARAAADLAAPRGAALVLWLQSSGEETWLWIYDADSGQLSQRPLPAGAPTSPETATAAALTAKTMIRLSVAAPPRERFGAPRRPARLHLEAGSELRVLRAGPTDERLLTQSVGASLAAGARWRLGADLAAGPGLAVDDARLVARFTRTTLSARARVRIAGGERWALEPQAWLGVHLTSLDGAVPGGGHPVAETRTNLSLGAAAGVRVDLGGGLELAGCVGLDVPLRRQRYLLAGQPILELPSVEPVLGLQVRVPIR